MTWSRWAWRPVAQELRAAGYRVLTPTLPGLHELGEPDGVNVAEELARDRSGER
jgi:predicted nuclease with RNAse H fold